VNTVIVLLGSPDDRRESGLEHTARFVMFKVPFEEVLSAETFKVLEAASERQRTDRWRITVRSQRDLFEEGLAREEDDEAAPAGTKSRGPLIKTARYLGNKWGGKYLRAPEIFFTILEKGRGKLVPLGHIAEVRRGFTTGANEFFYLDEEIIRKWGIEPEFLKPVIKSPRECRSIVIKPEDLKYKIFMCHKDKRELEGTAALEYIKWGESQGFHLRPSCRGRPRWWDVGEQTSFDFVALRFRHERNWTPINATPSLLAGDIMFVGSWNDRSAADTCNALANSTFAIFISELFGRVNLGEGLLTTYGPEIMQFITIDPSELIPVKGEIERTFDRLKSRDVYPVFEELHQPDRRALDEVVFDVLGLTAGEREAVYEAVVELVRARLEKARSV
jgi:hypothetical protein